MPCLCNLQAMQRQFYDDMCIPYLRLTYYPQAKMAMILADGNLKCIFWNKNDRTPTQVLLKFILRNK